MKAPDPKIARVDVAVVGVVVACSLVFRFLATSPLWLDEALSVNIASLPVGDIFEALRQDGHPPLYYVLLHYWMELVGDGDVAARTLSGLFGVAALPLVWILARRRGGQPAALAALLVTAVTPYMTRYATEVRMYSMVAVLVLVAWLLADDLRTRPDRARWFGLAVVTGLALLTHYWTMYLGVAAVGALAWRWWRSGARDEAIRIGSALAAGTLLFLPWLPSFLYQAANTGTPWGTATCPGRAVTEVVNALGGRGGNPEAILFGFLVLTLAVVGLLGLRGDDREPLLTLDLRTTPTVRPEVVVVIGTIAVGLAVGAVSSATFVARYAAGLVPLLFVAAGVGIALVPGRTARRVVAGSVVVLGAPGLVHGVIDDRSQGEEFAEAIEAHHGDDVADEAYVVFCPDQLGPATLRYLDDEVEAVGVPSFERPERIDWVDYADRNESADAAAVAARALREAGDRTVWLVHNDGYRTYTGVCSTIFEAFTTARSPSIEDATAEVPFKPWIFENAGLDRFDP